MEVPGVASMERDAPDARLTLLEVHDRYADFVWRSLQRLGVESDDLDDALQEVFVVVHKKLATFRGDARLTTWLYAISLRVAHTTRRRRRRLPEAVDPDASELAIVDPKGDPEAQALEREGRRRLERVLSAMTPAKRAVLVMFELERLSADAIGRDLGIPVGTVYSRLHAARAEFERAAARERRREDA
jgi:RNA polymerase sigma-70 factor, ECF subfamily